MADPPFELLPTRWEKPVTNFLLNLRGREKVEVVTTDMWKPYRKAVKIAMPQAVLVVDKWHVMRMANDAMETARRVYQGGQGISKETRKQLKKGWSIFLKRPYQLSPKQLLDLDGWLKNTPELAGAYECKEQFMDIWKARTATNALARLNHWRDNIPPHLYRLFKPVVTATTNWEAEIMAYFTTGRQWTNAATEARNRVVKMTNRIGAGYSFNAIRARALFGKRPGRVAKEKKDAQAEPAPASPRYLECVSCKALVPRGDHWKYDEYYVDGHVFEVAALCADCARFNTEEWFGAEGHSTPKSE
ncbi:MULTISPECIES: transposase [Novosphingobium]|uniref:Transposase n=1 Tax=Novosphingobium mangrovi (ex Huang et al. 2023) TaxID=2976432 RepID=A0ABT2IB66_9SPHN|nr:MULTISPECIES: transposase [Novosphingobium]MCT2402076.1 transposase [Novosphingobium mangrovi (ex Huang et al. 2023)]